MSAGHALLYVALIATVALAAFIACVWATFHYDPHNAYRRWCKRCGQRQELHDICDGLAEEWTPMGDIKDSGCNCHLHV